MAQLTGRSHHFWGRSLTCGHGGRQRIATGQRREHLERRSRSISRVFFETLEDQTLNRRVNLCDDV
jgi:hypothetical protein